MALSDTFSPGLTPVTSSGSSVSNREDLTDTLTILAPEETPPFICFQTKSECYIR